MPIGRRRTLGHPMGGGAAAPAPAGDGFSPDILAFLAANQTIVAPWDVHPTADAQAFGMAHG